MYAPGPRPGKREFQNEGEENEKKPPSIANYQQTAFTENIIAAGIIVSFLGLGCANDVY